jgi:hypothetical protein
MDGVVTIWNIGCLRERAVNVPYNILLATGRMMNISMVSNMLKQGFNKPCNKKWGPWPMATNCHGEESLTDKKNSRTIHVSNFGRL